MQAWKGDGNGDGVDVLVWWMQIEMERRSNLVKVRMREDRGAQVTDDRVELTEERRVERQDVDGGPSGRGREHGRIIPWAILGV